MDPVSEEALALLKLSLCKGVSTATIRALVERFGSGRQALEAPLDQLQELPGIATVTAEAVKIGPDAADVERELDLMERHRVHLVPFTSPDYPTPLKHLDSGAPALLRVKGEWRREDQLAVAIVGSRRSTQYGRAQAARLACDLADAGVTIVSGMAQGIDAAAHQGALHAKGRTIAVLGCGLAYRLPDEDLRLAAEIAASGAVMSELPMTTPPRPGNFPPRNRIISGLALGVIVVEAARRSGSLITARHAGEQGKAVFAVPGPVDSPSSHGCHELIRDGAVLVETARDVIEELGPLSAPIPLPAAGDEEGDGELLTDPRVLNLNERERGILDMLGATPLYVDDVIAQAGLAASIVASTLLTLEIRGLIRQLPGQRYVRP